MSPSSPNKNCQRKSVILNRFSFREFKILNFLSDFHPEQRGRLFERGAYKIIFLKGGGGRLFERGAYLRGALIRTITVLHN